MTPEVPTAMDCPPPDVLARLATGEFDDANADDAAALTHASECVHCRGHLDEQREVRTLATRLPAPTLSRSRRAALAAEVMARADQLDVAPPSSSPDDAADDLDLVATLEALRPRRRRTLLAVAGLAAAAAAVALALVSQRDATPTQLAAPTATPAPATTPVAPSTPPVPEQIAAAIADAAAAAPAPAATVTGPQADFAWDRDHRDTVELREGELAVNSVDTRAVQIVAGETRVDVARARAAVKAHHGVIQTVTVIAGSVEVVDQGRRHIIEAGMTWSPLPKPAAASSTASSSTASKVPLSSGSTAAGTAPNASDTQPGLVKPTAARASLDAFREGWTALRENRHRDAIAAFDRATDPVVVEDAAYWAAIAAERAGDKADATARFTAFSSKFPTSPRMPDAQLAIERLQR